MRWILGWAAFFATLSIGCAIVTEVQGGHFLTTYGPNMSTDLVGIALTITVVDAILARRRQQELAPLRRGRSIG